MTDDTALTAAPPHTRPLPAADPAPASRRRGVGDPVKVLMHRHRALCERAVDPLEIAAGLEAHGLTDRTAARFRHRDVFSLAEELYARVPRVEPSLEASAPAHRGGTRKGGSHPTGRAHLLALLPGALALLTAAAVWLSTGQTRLWTGLGGTLVVLVTLVPALRAGPLRSPAQGGPAGGICAFGLLAYAVCGDGLLGSVLQGGPDHLWRPEFRTITALVLALAPAVWCAGLFSALARRRLIGSRALEEFASGVRPLLLTVCALYVAALTGLLLLAGRTGGPLTAGVALGSLLFLARLLSVHGFSDAAATGLGAACAFEAAALTAALASRVPALSWAARPVEALTETAGPEAVPAVACGVAALALLARATTALSRASAHH
ncbi:hypothetical protein [Streptomyces sp. NPDC006879]|uniref:hypothetical protein n=1 Tax=Streptomyces sp. NPDC006879 TaxID=3364767 RepID=UPI0036B1C0A5